tara:strand:- start:458 stop:1447 length:990 start_codon:yes stop_codon:yes gene_type:complete
MKYDIEYKDPHKVFGIRKSKASLKFPKSVPVFKWESKHIDIPEIDKNYRFEPKSLGKVLHGLVSNSKVWISGETGTGKSSLINQVAANLHWPMMRINFDSEITRSDLVGRDVLKSENGNTVSEFIDGILPQAIKGPNIILLDEIDFVRPDIAYVLQSVLEDYGLRINEDGGRLVEVHEHSRIFATANTLGQGDTSANYSGARNQSAALRDRFSIWIDKDYLQPYQEIKLLSSKSINLTKDGEIALKKYITAHRRAYRHKNVYIPLTPRSLETAGKLVNDLIDNDLDLNESFNYALELAVINKCEDHDRSVLTGLVQRHFPISKTQNKSK